MEYYRCSNYVAIGETPNLLAIQTAFRGPGRAIRNGNSNIVSALRSATRLQHAL